MLASSPGFTKRAYWIDTVVFQTRGMIMNWIVGIVVIAAVAAAVYYFGYMPRWW